MVKLPGIDDLKKMGSGLIDSAKSVKIGEMVGKLKSGIESTVGSKGHIPQSNEEVKKLFEDIHTELNSLAEEQAKSTNTIRKIHGQLVELAKAYDAMNVKPKEKKSDES